MVPSTALDLQLRPYAEQERGRPGEGPLRRQDVSATRLQGPKVVCVKSCAGARACRPKPVFPLAETPLKGLLVLPGAPAAGCGRGAA